MLLVHPNCHNINWNVTGRWTDIGATVFIYACRHGHREMVKLLLDHCESKSIDINARKSEGICLNGLDAAIIDVRSDVVKVILDHPAAKKHLRINDKNPNGQTAFILACLVGREDIVKTFLEYSKILNINLNTRDDNGCSGWMHACRGGRRTIVKLLLKHPELIDYNCHHEIMISKEVQDILMTHNFDNTWNGGLFVLEPNSMNSESPGFISLD